MPRHKKLINQFPPINIPNWEIIGNATLQFYIDKKLANPYFDRKLKSKNGEFKIKIEKWTCDKHQNFYFWDKKERIYIGLWSERRHKSYYDSILSKISHLDQGPLPQPFKIDWR